MGTAYVGQIKEVLSDRGASLSLPAGANANDASAAIGGLTRNGIILNNVDRIEFDEVRIDAGSPARGEDPAHASALRILGNLRAFSFTNVELVAPRNRMSHNAAIRTDRNDVMKAVREKVQVSGFDQVVGSAR